MKLIKIILKLLSKKEKKYGIFVVILVTIMALLDAAGVISIIPFLAILGNPEMVEENGILKQLYIGSKKIGVQNINDFLIFLGVSALLLIIFSSCFRILTHYVLNHFVEMRRHSISEKLLKNYLSLPYSSFLNKHSGELSKTILSEVDQFVGQILRPVTNMLVYLIVLVVLVTLLLFINPFLTILICAVFSFLYGVFFLMLQRFFIRIGSNRIKANKDRFVIISEIFGSIKYIKLLGKEEIYFSQFGAPSSQFSKMQANFQTFTQAPKFIVEGIGFGSILILTVFLIGKYGGIENGALGEILPTLGLYTFSAYRLLPAATNIYQGLSSLNYGSASIHELYENSILDNALTVESSTPLSFKKRIFLDDISYLFSQSDKPALENITLEIPFGKSLGIIGTTGSGKTTLIDIILGLLEPSNGTLNVDGVVITKENRKSWQKLLGYVPQEIILTHCSILENIAFGLPKNEIDMAKVINCAKLAHIHDFISNDLPYKYETLVGERGTRLSGGQRQRIGIARALYNDPEVLILDEATSALDTRTELKVIKSIESLHGDKTIILITHRMTAIKNCEYVLKLENGKIKKNYG